MTSAADGPPRVLAPQPLTAEAFAPFGDVIEVSPRVQTVPVNDGTATRYHDLARVETAGADARAAISIFRAAPLPAPIRIAMMERHPLGSQAFVPLQQRPFLVVVAPSGDLDPGALQAFRARGDQGVNYAPGVWHHFLLALEAESDFLVVDRIGEGDNLDVVRLGPGECAIITP